MNLDGFTEVDTNFVDSNYKSADLVDLGEIMINDAREYEMLLKYIDALKSGDETYKPAELKFVKKGVSEHE